MHVRLGVLITQMHMLQRKYIMVAKRFQNFVLLLLQSLQGTRPRSMTRNVFDATSCVVERTLLPVALKCIAPRPHRSKELDQGHTTKTVQTLCCAIASLLLHATLLSNVQPQPTQPRIRDTTTIFPGESFADHTFAGGAKHAWYLSPPHH